MSAGWAGLVAVVLVAVAVPQAAAQFSSDYVKVSVVAEREQVAAGSDVPIAIIFEHDAGWHIHTNDIKNPPLGLGDAESLVKTQIKASVTVGGSNGQVTLHTGFIQWPKVGQTNVGSKLAPEMYDVYKGKAVAFLPVTVAQDAKPGTVTITVLVTYQACGKLDPLNPDAGEVCMAPVRDEKHEVTLTIIAPGAAPPGGVSKLEQATLSQFDASIWPRIRSGEKAPQVVEFALFRWKFSIDVSGTLGLVLLLFVAGVGGFLLNLTPCVLPVIPLKIMGLSQSAGNRGRTLALGATMSLGVIAFWLTLGALIAAATSALARGESGGITSTNQLFQYPVFTLVVGAVIAIMAIGMCGLFSIRLPNFVYAINPKHDSFLGSFGFGVMTAILSTPCTAPFMGSAAAWAATQPAYITLIVFAAIGGGMAIPYLVLAAFPKLVSFIPRSGAGNELLKQVMGLFMLAAALYFIGVGIAGLTQTPPDPPTLLYWWPVMGMVIASGAWLAWRIVRIKGVGVASVVIASLGILFMVGGVLGGKSLTDRGPINWVYYTPERFEAEQKKGNVIVLEFTAEWCLNCKALEKSVLNQDAVVAAFHQQGVVPMKVDLTGNNGPGNLKLKETGSISIPWLTIYTPGNERVFGSEFYTGDQILEAVAEAKARAVAAKLE
ncbi:MAG: cytochrome c biogenesis protein CcdA [Phycisphaeraceae bacterium]